MGSHFQFKHPRITPAPAGKTKITCHFYLRKLDHPRTCGENSSTSLLRYIIGGSPPHLRGKPGQIFYDHLHQRITPAPAGKTGCVLPVGCTVEDHPRTCGENISNGLVALSGALSPPHLRGKHREAEKQLLCERITPAPAGKTIKNKAFLISVQDHPRTCGEN